MAEAKAKELLFKVELLPDYSCKINLGGYELLAMLDELKVCLETHDKMGAWLDDASVPIKQKESFLPMHQNLLHTISFVWSLAKRAGVSEADIKKYLNVPF